MDEITATLKILYDQYGDCAGKVIELIRCAQGGSCDGLQWTDVWFTHHAKYFDVGDRRLRLDGQAAIR
nr:hypothetical protein [Providencia rettgeri]